MGGIAETISDGTPSVFSGGTAEEITLRALGELPELLPGRSSVGILVGIVEEIFGEFSGTLSKILKRTTKEVLQRLHKHFLKVLHGLRHSNYLTSYRIFYSKNHLDLIGSILV